MKSRNPLWRIAAVLFIALAVQSTANAQFGVLKQIGKAVSENKDKNKSDNKSDKNKNSYFDKLSEEQQWAVMELTNPQEAPDCPWPMTQNDKWRDPKFSYPSSYLDYMQEIDKVPMEEVQDLVNAMNTRYRYTKRVLKGLKGVSYSELGNDYLMFDQEEKERELDRYDAFKSAVGKTNIQAFFQFAVVEDGQGGYKITDNSQAIIPYGGYIANKGGKWMFTFSNSGKNTTFATAEEVENCKKYIDRLTKLEVIAYNPFKDKPTDDYLIAHYMQDIIREAIANNSTDNIVYAAYPQGSSLNTPEMKAAAKKIFEKSYPGDKIYDVVITGEWVYHKNALGVVIDRSADVAIIAENPVAKSLIRAQVGNDRIGENNWGDLRWYGIYGHTGYVR